MSKKARLIAFYLPQYHPIPENDKWWGKGFTEWTNVAKAKPLFKNHYQPHLPADLGFYDLRVPEVREAQAEMAKQYGIDGFCYYHYWFGHGKRLLERPFQEVVKSGKPDFPFCLCWANQTWSGIWHGAPDKILIEQKYPGEEDYKAHFYALLDAFKDSRYMTVNGKLIFVIYNPSEFRDIGIFMQYWQELAKKEGLEGFHFVAHLFTRDNAEQYGCDAFVDGQPFITMPHQSFLYKILMLVKKPTIRHYAHYVSYMKNRALYLNEYPLIIPNWDNTPRSGVNGWILNGSTPLLFQELLNDALKNIDKQKKSDSKIVFIKAWNEWAEGNYLEPDMKFGHEYLRVVKESLED